MVSDEVFAVEFTIIVADLLSVRGRRQQTYMWRGLCMGRTFQCVRGRGRGATGQEMGKEMRGLICGTLAVPLLH